MEYTWRIPSDFYIMIKGDYIGKIERVKSFTEEHSFGFPWTLKFRTPPIVDFDLEEILISSTFDLYEKREVRRFNDNKNAVLYYKFSNCELTRTYKQVSGNDDLTDFYMTIESTSRESIANLPEEIKE